MLCCDDDRVVILSFPHTHLYTCHQRVLNMSHMSTFFYEDLPILLKFIHDQARSRPFSLYSYIKRGLPPFFGGGGIFSLSHTFFFLYVSLTCLISHRHSLSRGIDFKSLKKLLRSQQAHWIRDNAVIPKKRVGGIIPFFMAHLKPSR